MDIQQISLDSHLSDAVSISSQESTTSTVMFHHEPFTDFKFKVLALCNKTWPTLPDSAFVVEHMSGGSNNRLIGVKVDFSKRKLPWLERQAQKLNAFLCGDIYKRRNQIREYVVRTPRSENAYVEHDIAMLLFLTSTGLPTPRIKTYHLTDDNPIGRPYSIQPRIPGVSVDDVYLNLNTSQRISFAQDLGKFLADISHIRSPSPGMLDPDCILINPGDVKLFDLQYPVRNTASPQSLDEPMEHSKPCSVFDFISTRLKRQRQYDLTLNREYIDPWSRFTAIMDELNRQKLFTHNMYYLTHMDFEPRNIMINITSPTTARLAAVLDWDEAIFAPVFLNCKSPSWLWDFEGDDDEELDETIAHKTPSDPDLASIKTAFETAVGETYLNYSYSEEYRIARIIGRFAITGIHSSDGYDLAENTIEQWNAFRPDRAVRSLYDYGDADPLAQNSVE